MTTDPDSIVPVSLNPVAAVIGTSATVSVMRVYAGARLYIPLPENLRDDHPICRLLGGPLAIQLAEILGGSLIDVPKGTTQILKQREDEIIRRWRRGDSARIIARSYGLTERAIFRVIAAAKNRAGST